VNGLDVKEAEKMRTSAIFPAVALLMVVVATAQADTYGTVNLTETGVSPQVVVNLYATPDFTSGVGVYDGTEHWLLDSASVNSNPYGLTNTNLPTSGFCIEMQYSGGSAPYNIVDLKDAPVDQGPLVSGVVGPMGATKAAYIQELWYNHIGDTNTDIGAAAFQTAVWEIVYENAQSWNVNTWDPAAATVNSSFKIDNTDVGNLANQWLNGLNMDGTGPKANVIAFSNANEQDFIGAAPVPAPAALLLGLMGLSGLGVLMRRFA
jgi:hypothetical protein